MLPSGTKLYDENNTLNPEKANSYIYNAFKSDYKGINDNIAENILIIPTSKLIDFCNVHFEKNININKKVEFDTKWELKELSKILTTTESGSRPKGGVSHVSSGVFSVGGEHISPTGVLDVTTPKFVPIDFYNRSEKGKIKPYDILMCKDGALTGKVWNSTGVGTAGRVTLFDLDGDFVVDSHITIVRIDNLKATPKYIMYASANIGFKNIEAMANGQSGQIELVLPTIKSIRVPLPPLDKQKEIVAEIETIEIEIKNIQDEIKQLSEQKKAILEKYL